MVLRVVDVVTEIEEEVDMVGGGTCFLMSQDLFFSNTVSTHRQREEVYLELLKKSVIYLFYLCKLLRILSKF